MDFGSLSIGGGPPGGDGGSGDFPARGVSAQQLQFKKKPRVGSGLTGAVRVEKSFGIGAVFSLAVHPTTSHSHQGADDGRQSRDFHPAVIHVDRGVTLALTRATLDTHPGDSGSCGTLTLATDDNDEYLTLCDFRRPNEERSASDLGVTVSGPRSIRLGISHWRGTYFGVSINVFGSVVAGGGGAPSPFPGQDEQGEGAPKGAGGLDGHIVPGKAAVDGQGDAPAEAAVNDEPPEKTTKKTAKKSKKRKLLTAAATEEQGEAAPKEDDDGDRAISEAADSNGGTATSSPPESSSDAGPGGEKLTKKQRKKLAKKKAQELAEVVAEAEGHAGKESKKSEKKKGGPAVPQTRERRLDGGVRVSDIIIGTGATVRPGRMVAINYEGALTDGKVFDKNKSKKSPLEFRPGTGEVIKGLERGLEGMKAGGERIITVPPAMGYGRKGSGNVVPGNATLVFTVNLVRVGGR